MKKLFIIFLMFGLFLPLYAQETEATEEVPAEQAPAETVSEEEALQAEMQEHIDDIYASMEMLQNNGDSSTAETETADADGVQLEDSFTEDLPGAEPGKKKFDFVRKTFEFGFGVNAGFDNNFIGLSDIFKKEIVIDLNKVRDDINDDGVNLNLDLSSPSEILHLDVKNIKIGGGLWDFGFFAGADTGVNLNLPKSLFVLIAEGNINQHAFKGMISAKGAAFADAGLRSSAQYGKLRAGLTTSIFTPLIYIPKSGISYDLQTTDDGLSVIVGGGPNDSISIYSPFFPNNDPDDGDVFSSELNFGADFSLEGEYALFNFLDVGGSFENIPLGGVPLQNRMLMSLKEPVKIDTDGLLQSGDSIEIPEADFSRTYDKHKTVRVFRPLRFDVYARYRPLSHFFPDNNLLTVKPNMGFSVDLNDEKEGFFNAGLELEVNLLHMFLFHIGSGIEDSVWKQRVGFTLNFRAFEMNLELMGRSSDFAGSFGGQGFGVKFGLCFGW